MAARHDRAAPSGRRSASAAAPVVAAAAVGVVFTVLAFATPLVRFSYRQPSLHLMIETAGALIAGLAAFLLYGRFLQRRLREDFLCIYAFGVFALTNLALSALPAALAPDARQGFLAWSAMTARLVGALALAVAAWAPRRPLRSLHGARPLLLAVTASVAVVGVVTTVVEPVLPAAVDSVDAGVVGGPSLTGHPVLLGAQLVAMAAFAAAAVGFWRRARGGSDALLRWLAAGSVLAAFSRLHFFVLPSVYSQYVYSGDLLRLGFYLLLLVGVELEIRSYWRSAAERATLDERRRIARDLHDGLAQELAFVTTQLRHRSPAGDPEALRPISAAAERALSESRRAIHMLTTGRDEPLPRALAQTVEEVAGRMGASVVLDLDEDVAVPPSTREELVRVVREAVSNAVRHGAAPSVVVELRGGDELTLRVRDDGDGFDPESVGRDGFGLTSMRERAEALGGRCRVRSRPGGGTEVEVTVPWSSRSVS